MGKDSTNDITYYLVIDIANKEDLGLIRNWNTLKAAFEDGKIWITGFDTEQIQATEIKSIPFKSLYYEKNGKLFFLHSLLPERTVPSLLWTPIDRALQIELPSFNHNYFGMKEKIEIKLIPSEEIYESIAMITTIHTLGQYIETAPSIRLQNLHWAVLDNDKAFVVGTPLLPVLGDVYYKRGDFIIPSGYNFDLHSLVDALNNVINPNQNYWIVWNRNTSYFKISKNDMQPISISSYRKTIHRFSSL